MSKGVGFVLDRNRIIKKLKEYFKDKEEIEFAYLFGSIATGEISKFSDVDIAVMCKNECNILQLMYEIGQILEFDEVDVVDLKKLKNNSILMDIIREGYVLKDSEKRELWEVENYHKILDFFTSTRLIYGY